MRAVDGAWREMLADASPKLVAPLLLLASAALAWAYADYGLPPPDEGASLTAAAKILQGLVYYRDIDAYPFPGTSYLLAFAMGVFGEHLAVARALAGAGFCLIVLGTYAAALAFLDRRRAALCGLALLSLKFLAFPMYTMFFYGDFALAACLVGLAIFLRHDYRGASLRLVALGVCVGIAIVSKQNAGIYVGGAIVSLLAWPGLAGFARARRGDRWAELGAFAVGAAVPVGAMSAYFAYRGLFGPMITSGLLRPLTSYLPSSGVSFLPPLRWWELGSWHGGPYLPLLYLELWHAGALPGEAWQRAYEVAGEVFSRLVYSSLPVAFLGCAWLRLRALWDPGPASDTLRERRSRFFASAGVSFAVTASAFPRADLYHILPIFPVVLVTLFGLGPGVLTSRNGRRSRPPTVTALAVGAVLLLTGTLALRHESLLTDRLILDRATLRVRPRDVWVGSVVRYVQQHVPPGAPLFVYGHEAQFYFLTDRYWPWRFSQLYPGMAGGDEGGALARLLDEQQPQLVLRGLHGWSGMVPIPSYTAELFARVRRDYVVATDELFAEFPSRGPRPPGFVFELLRRSGPPHRLPEHGLND